MDEVFLHVHTSAIKNNQFYLSTNESNHFIRSLRGSVGDEVWLLNGEGLAFQAHVENIDKLIVSGKIKKTFSNYGENNKNIHLVIGLIKGKRMEIAVEKSIEFGVKSIHPVVFERSIKKTLNIERLNKIIVSSAKQSGRSFFPELKKPVKFSDWIEKYKKNKQFVCHFSGKFSLDTVVTSESDEIMIIVGPEGDFSSSELSLLSKHEIPMVNLAPRRLRSESACMSAIIGTSNIIEA